MKITVLAETDANEPRVAATPETVKKFANLGADVTVVSGAGSRSFVSDDLYEAAGAKIVASNAEGLKDADIVLSVRRPEAKTVGAFAKGTTLIGMLDPHGNENDIEGLAKANVDAFTMEFMPRITRAQVMDVLSSQANIAGYQAVIEGASNYGMAIPMMMTAAGTVPAAKIFVMGAGVAGLQAIATARRLGAVVTATDVRPASKEQVESLGGKFIAVEDEEFKQAETAGGYAKEMSDEYKAKQAELVASHIAKQNMVITTALIPGRPAPKLVTEDMVKAMPPGGVVVDLAAERGGNCELTEPGKIVEKHDVKIVGLLNLPGHLAATSSNLYSRNLYAFLETLVDKEAKALKVDWEDELVAATNLTRNGAVVHPAFAPKESGPEGSGKETSS